MNKRIPRDYLSKGTLLCQLPEVISGAENDEVEPPVDPAAPKEPVEKVEKVEEPAEDVSGLKSALTKERKRANDTEKELKRLQKEKEDRELAEKSELDQAKTKEQKASEKVTKLAEGLLRRDLNHAIEKEAAKLNFIDIDDAIEFVDRSLITYEQDEDDPSIITIDQSTVEKVVKALATKKPHFIQQGTEDGEPTGGKFGGQRKKSSKTTEEALREKYSALG